MMSTGFVQLDLYSTELSVYVLLFPILSRKVGPINSATFSKAFDEWRYFNFEIHCLQQSCCTDCPCCSVSQHSVHVDGNKKLYRYAKVPR